MQAVRLSGCLDVQYDATTLLNINQNKKLEEMMANSEHNQVKGSMLGAVTQGR
ncbi:hypothetical protein [Aeromonas caviae]|uniref:Uncharacterized protein n=1 Tax=Aeromonas caviae TaxID=648 RepID=A0AAV4YHV8_AERCA|nr:hypothetical protein [Aeromonas caviae]MEA9429520.1 hypothetical protein [Aeromonas caviae]BDA18936.1 hypothetical protein KAM345_028500 [Aeromonas caviae]GJA32476.1 hypothetical protein KAM341_21540 [Aeromonas caviae]GJA36888.1 hypothetical protein KAM342_21310 [Aeromonas caviae]GJA40718.1 hypothetical protein KAM343_15140 [Aeromonas caviae]